MQDALMQDGTPVHALRRGLAPPGSAAQMRWLTLATIAALALGLAWRFIGLDRPFWVDETFTGAIALRPTVGELIRDCLREAGGPVYYSFAWGWAKLFGVSNLALRLPSVFFSMAAALLILWRGNPDRRVRLVWASLAALCFASVYYSTEARSYTLLFLLGTAQAIVLRRLLIRATLGGAFAWCALSALMLLTHYYTAPLVALQGLVYLAAQRQHAVRTWPAALLFLPVFAWAAVHLPFVMLLSKPGVVWQPLVRRDELLNLSGNLLGIRIPWFLLLVAAPAAAAIVADLRNWRRDPAALPYHFADLAIVGCSLGATIVIVGYGMLKPSFTPRYLVPFLPGLLLGPALLSVAWSRRWPMLPLALVAVFLLFGAKNIVQSLRVTETGFRTSIIWQPAAEALIAGHARHVAFFWDSSQNTVVSPEILQHVGAFFFDRAHAGTAITPVILTYDEPVPDPNRVLPMLLDRSVNAARPDGFIWLYHTAIGRRSIGNEYPPRLTELADRGFACRNYGAFPDVVVIGCLRTAARSH